MRGLIGDFSAWKVDAAGSAVVLEWDYVKDDPDLAGFQIYRSFDTSAMHSYAYITADEAIGTATAASSNQFYAYIDFDTDFRVPVQTVYTAVIDSNTVVTGGSVTTVGSATTVTPASQNLPQNPQSGVTIYYWVMARYIDGGYSALSEREEVGL